MGIVIGRFRKKKSTYEILEKLENEITSIEEFGRSTEQYRKKVISRFIILSVSSFLVLTLGLYFFYHKISTDQQFLYFVPSAAFPLVVWVIKKFLTWYYSRKILKNEKKIIKLKEEKRKILENVMETETYKVAKKILDKFGNEPVKKSQFNLIEATPKSTPLASKGKSIVPLSLRPNQTGLRQRIAIPQTVPSRLSYGSAASNSPLPLSTARLAPTRSAGALTMTPMVAMTPNVGAMVSAGAPVPGTPLQMPRSIPPRDRSVLDKMVDYLVGDGPSNRYALICRQCSSHNGMALQEEFEYLSFRCCYCQSLNPARKQRPTGPKFEPQTPLKALNPSEDSSDSDTDSEQQETIEKGPRRDSSDTARCSDFDKLSDIETKESELGSESEVGLKSEVELKSEVGSRSAMEDSDGNKDRKNVVRESGDASGSAQDSAQIDSPMDVDTENSAGTIEDVIEH